MTYQTLPRLEAAPGSRAASRTARQTERPQTRQRGRNKRPSTCSDPAEQVGVLKTSALLRALQWALKPNVKRAPRGVAVQLDIVPGPEK